MPAQVKLRPTLDWPDFMRDEYAKSRLLAAKRRPRYFEFDDDYWII
jgi:hypothetical protein